MDPEANVDLDVDAANVGGMEDVILPTAPGCVRGPSTWSRKGHASFDAESRAVVLTVYLSGARLKRLHWAALYHEAAPSTPAVASAPPSDNALDVASESTRLSEPEEDDLSGAEADGLARFEYGDLPQWVDDLLPTWLVRRFAPRTLRRRPVLAEALEHGGVTGGRSLPALPDEVWELILTLLPIRPDEYHVETFGLLGTGWSANPPAMSCQLWIDPCSVIPCSGNRVIVVDSGHNRLTMLIAASNHPRLLSLAGDTEYGHKDGAPASARFAFPRGAALDHHGTIWVTDRNCVRRLARGTLEVTTEGPQHAVNIRGAGSPFKLPQCVAVDDEGRLYIADTYNNRIRRLEPDGTAPVIAGTGERMYKDGPGEVAGFSRPRATVLDRNGDILVADSLNHCIRRLCVRTGVVSTVAGTGREGYSDGPAETAHFREPSGLAVDAIGNIVVADRGNGLVRLITTEREVSTIAGHIVRPSQWDDPTVARPAQWDNPANQFFFDAKGPHATFSRPTGIAVDEKGAIIVTDSHTDRVRKVTLAPHTFSASYPAPQCFRNVRAPENFHTS